MSMMFYNKIILQGKIISILSILIFVSVISSYYCFEVLERIGVVNINVQPHPKFYRNVFGNLQPNLSATAFWHPKLPYHYRINHDGFRSNGIVEQAPGKKILCLGDSYTFGISSSDRDTFPSLLEQQFQAEHKMMTVVNGGSPDTGIEDHYLYYKDKAREIKPNIVILQFNVYDIDLLQSKPRYTARQSGLKYIRIKDDFLLNDISTYFVRLFSRCGLDDLFDQDLPIDELKRSKKQEISHTDDDAAALRKVLSDRHELLDERNNTILAPLWERYLNTLQKLHDLVVADGARFIVLIIPDPGQINYYENGPSAAIGAYCKQHNIDVVDMTRVFRALKFDQGVTPYHDPYDLHCNEIGNTLIANALKSKIERNQDDSPDFRYDAPYVIEVNLSSDGELSIPKNNIIELDNVKEENITIKKEAGGGVNYISKSSDVEPKAKLTVKFKLLVPIVQASAIFFPHIKNGDNTTNKLDVTINTNDVQVGFSTSLTKNPKLWNGFDREAFLECKFPSETNFFWIDVAMLNDSGIGVEEKHTIRPFRRFELYLYPTQHN